MPESSCIWAKVVVLGQMWLYSGKLVLFGKVVFIKAMWLYFEQKWLKSEKFGCIQQKSLYS